MQDVLDAISKLLNQQWIDESIRYSDGMTDWDIGYIQSRQLLHILGRPPHSLRPPIIDLQMFCASAREDDITSYCDGKMTVIGKALLLQALGDSYARSGIALYLWPDGRLEVNVWLGTEAISPGVPA